MATKIVYYDGVLKVTSFESKTGGGFKIEQVGGETKQAIGAALYAALAAILRALPPDAVNAEVQEQAQTQEVP